MKNKKDKFRLYRSASYFNLIYNDKDRKPITKIILEFLTASIKTKCVATHYFTSFLYKSNIRNYLDYLSQKEMRRPQVALCNKNAVDILHNKLLFQHYYEKAGIRVPRLLAYNFNETLYFEVGKRNHSQKIADTKSMREAMDTLLANSTDGSIFIKLISTSGGVGARKISGEFTAVSDQYIAELSQYVLSNSFVFQDEVAQHSVLSKINSSSLNTVRIDTFKQADKDPEILSAYLRVGMAGSCVDNVKGGGLFVGINLEDGTLKEEAHRYLVRGGAVYRSHPDSGVTFKGMLVPCFKEAKQLAYEAASLLPQAMVGWDIAVSSQGVVLMEGNAVYYDMQVSDIAYGGYRKNPVYMKVHDAYKHKTK